MDLARIDKESREKIVARVRQLVAASERLSKATSTISIKGNHVYLSQRCLPLDPDSKSAKALIAGLPVEKAFARITVLDKSCSRCTLDWPSPSKPWKVLAEASLDECVDILSKETYFEESSIP